MNTDPLLPSRPAASIRPTGTARIVSALFAGSLLISPLAQADDGSGPDPAPATPAATGETTTQPEADTDKTGTATPPSPAPASEPAPVSEPASEPAPDPAPAATPAEVPGPAPVLSPGTSPATSPPTEARPDAPATPDVTAQPVPSAPVEALPAGAIPAQPAPTGPGSGEPASAEPAQAAVPPSAPAATQAPGAQGAPAREASRPVPIPESGLPAQPKGSRDAPAARPPAAPDTAGTAQQIRHCQVPASLQPPPIKLPGLSGALVRNQQDVLVIVLGAETVNTRNGTNGSQAPSVRSRARAQRIPLAPRLQARLGHDLGPLVQQRLKVESMGKPHSTVAEQAALIGKQILPRKPALVVWNLGLSDVSRGQPPARFARALDRGLAQLRKQRIDTIVLDLPYHPQYEALYRTDDYRQYIRWTMNLHDQPFLRRFDMVDYWDSTGRIDLDSTEPERQATAGVFIDTCVAYQLSQMIDKALN